MIRQLRQLTYEISFFWRSGGVIEYSFHNSTANIHTTLYALVTQKWGSIYLYTIYINYISPTHISHHTIHTYLAVIYQSIFYSSYHTLSIHIISIIIPYINLYYDSYYQTRYLIILHFKISIFSDFEPQKIKSSSTALVYKIKCEAPSIPLP